MLKKINFGKRQIVIAALILALGAAVYLNWQFTSYSPVAKETAATSSTSSEDEDSLGIAQLVNNSYIETVNDEIEEDTPSVSVSAKLSQARIDRQTSRGEALDLLEDVLADVDADSDTKQQAINEAAIIAQNMVKETNIESVIKAKGVNDVVVIIGDSACNVIVDSLGDNALIIQDVITSQTDITPESISIIEAQAN